MRTRDFVVVGASLGGIEALSALAGGLPEDLPAALLVVQHTADHAPGLLAGILAGRGPLPAVTAEPGMEPRRGRIHVAPPDRHLLLAADGIRVVFGPRENRSRPAIDPLFRTAAVNYRSRVVGVILSGLLDDGAAGLRAIERCGGMPLVQAPGDAAHPEMPRSALAAVAGARQVALAELGPLLSRLTREPAPAPPPVPEALRIEARLTERAMRTEDWNQVPGRSTDFTCPECRGALARDRVGVGGSAPISLPGRSCLRCRGHDGGQGRRGGRGALGRAADAAGAGADAGHHGPGQPRARVGPLRREHGGARARGPGTRADRLREFVARISA
jgi:two-component system, chemotaxis family, protein-glutamate methylesterase/glutaminase